MSFQSNITIHLNNNNNNNININITFKQQKEPVGRRFNRRQNSGTIQNRTDRFFQMSITIKSMYIYIFTAIKKSKKQKLQLQRITFIHSIRLPVCLCGPINSNWLFVYLDLKSNITSIYLSIQSIHLSIDQFQSIPSNGRRHAAAPHHHNSFQPKKKNRKKEARNATNCIVAGILDWGDQNSAQLNIIKIMTNKMIYVGVGNVRTKQRGAARHHDATFFIFFKNIFQFL